MNGGLLPSRSSVLLVGLVLVACGCQQQMAAQPSFKPLAPCEFCDDDRSARLLVRGTVARGHLRTDRALFTGRKPVDGLPPSSTKAPPSTDRAPQGDVSRKRPQGPSIVSPEEAENFVDDFPFPVTKAVLEHGRHRFMIYCVVCHDPLGTGEGKIVERGYTAPPSFHIPRLRHAPPGRLFAVISEGYGSMPSYDEQIPVRDRWAIAGYVRALQLSQHFPAGDLSPAMRRKWVEQSEATAAGEASP